MDTKIEKRLKSYNKRANIELFFDLTNKLITELGIDKDNPRFALCVRNVPNRQRISVNINSRLIGGLKNEGKEDVLIFMLYTDYANELKSNGHNVISMGKEYAPTGNLAAADAFQITIETYLNLREDITTNWIACCGDYLPSQVSSQRRIHHLPELFTLVADNNYRKEQLDKLFNIYNMEFFKNEDIEYYYHVSLNDSVYRTNDVLSQQKGMRIKTTIFDKTNYWASLVNEIEPEFIYRPDNMWQMSGKIKDYSWVRFNVSKHRGFKVFFTVGINGRGKSLLMKIDCQRGNTDKLEDELITKFDELKKELKVNDYSIYHSAIDTFTWDSLVNQTVNYFKNNMVSYNRIIAELFGDNSIEIESPDPYLNQILFGSPGTSKTYNTRNIALKIINEEEEQVLDYNDREAVRIQYEKRVKDGRIVFTTFHQSMSYEDFIEGIKPIEPKVEGNSISYRVTDGIFMGLCRNASLKNKFQVKLDSERKELTKELFEDLYYGFSEQLPEHISETSTYKLKTQEGYEFQLFRNSADSIVVKAGKKKTNMSVSCNELINVLFNGKQPVYKSYEQIIIDKILEGRDFENNTIDNSGKPFVLIIDEINRGNVSAIFGELITLIESDKRLGEKEELTVTLPYSKKEFGVPANLYIIGTMNTADRSVESLDTALRRRFHFTEMPPLYDLAELQTVVFDSVTPSNILKEINERIEYLLNRDHLIGHCYFINVKSITELNYTFFKNIIPLLQEYFYGDYAKMSLVIGQGFFEPKKGIKDINWPISDKNIEIPEREVLNLKAKMTDEDFREAIILLFGKTYE